MVAAIEMLTYNRCRRVYRCVEIEIAGEQRANMEAVVGEETGGMCTMIQMQNTKVHKQ